MSDGLFTVFKHSKSTFIMLYLYCFSKNVILILFLKKMLYLYHEMTINYLVVDKMANISKLFDHNCILRIGCKPMMLIT
jgi:hypothetical protein